MCTVCRAECVVDIDFGKRCKLFCKFGVVLGLARVKADVLKQDGFAFLQGCDLCLGVFADDVLREGDLAAEQLIETVCNRLQRELHGVVLLCLCQQLRLCGSLLSLRQLLDLLFLFLVQTEALGEDSVRLAHMGAENDLCAVVQQIFDGRQSRNDALVARDLAILQRDVEVAADENFLALDFDVFNGLLVVHENTLLYINSIEFPVLPSSI